MGKSLRDQLMSAGMATKHQALKAQSKKNKSNKKARTSGEKNDSEKNAIMVKQQQQQLAERDKQLNLELEKKRQAKALAAQIKQLINNNKLARIHGTEFIRFVDDNKVKKILVTAEMLQQLETGVFAVVKDAENYEVIPTKIADKIAEIKPEIIFNLSIKEELSANEKDWYDKYPIPDDLMW